jgi:membrane protein YqaA with SNARE-associated domain
MDLVAMMIYPMTINALIGILDNGMKSGSLLLSVTLISFAIWLRRYEDRAWAEAGEREETDESSIDRNYLKSRSKSRRTTNRLVGVSGVLILLTTFVGHPVAWMTGWLLVMLCLLIVIGLAGKDAIATHRYHQKKLDAVRRMLE